MLTPTPSVWPYGYSICIGVANDGVALSEIVSVGCGADWLGGSEWAVGWLEMLVADLWIVCSKVGAGGSWESGRGMRWWW